MAENQEFLVTEHIQSILEQYHKYYRMYEEMSFAVKDVLQKEIEQKDLIIAALESRVKTEKSLTGKLELKGDKYSSIFDITDIVGFRVITFYEDDVEKVASIIERYFEIDWENSVDKRKAKAIDSFGYQSLHYICRIPQEAYFDPEHPEINQVRFEVQMRTVLQHAWANMNHDTGYKSGVEVPAVYVRQLSRLAGMLELVDDEFSRIRTEINDYRRSIQSLVASGNLNEVPLDGETFKNYLGLKPFDSLNRRIAAVNQAEIMEVSLFNYLTVFKRMQFATLGDIDRFIKENSEAAYQLARFQIGLSDLDIISSSLGPQSLCIVHVLKYGFGKSGIKLILDAINGQQSGNEAMADYLYEQATSLPFMNIHGK